jgi:hypothetical protein
MRPLTTLKYDPKVILTEILSVVHSFRGKGQHVVLHHVEQLHTWTRLTQDARDRGKQPRDLRHGEGTVGD